MAIDLYNIAFEFHRLAANAILLAGKCILGYSALIPLSALVSTRQEYKIWKSTASPMTPYAIFKCFTFNFVWMVTTLVASLALVPMWAGRGFGSSVEKEAHCVIEKMLAILLTEIFHGGVEIVDGSEENIPDMTLDGVEEGPAPIFVANHFSQLDTAVVYFALSRFKWIAKQSVKFIPGPGNLMSLSGHIFIKRKGNNTNSKNDLFKQSNDNIQRGIPLFIFPQGTRRISERLPFKDGAFKIAIENESLLVPISLDIPLGIWESLYPFNKLWGAPSPEAKDKITITIHKGIQAKKDSDREILKAKCDEAIYSALPPHWNKSGSNGKKSD